MANKKTKERITRRAEAIVAHFDLHYGEESSRLAAWQKFSRDVGVAEGPSITQCKKILKRVHVNIVDFVHAKKNHREVFHFESRVALARYIQARPQKRFPLAVAKEDSFLKTLLIQLF